MSALKFARRCLLASLAIYSAMLLLVWLPLGPGELWALFAMLAVFVMTLSAAVCLALQARTALAKRAQTKIAPEP